MNNQELAKEIYWKYCPFELQHTEEDIKKIEALLNKERPFETGERIQNEMMIELKDENAKLKAEFSEYEKTAEAGNTRDWKIIEEQRQEINKLKGRIEWAERFIAILKKQGA